MDLKVCPGHRDFARAPRPKWELWPGSPSSSVCWCGASYLPSLGSGYLSVKWDNQENRASEAVRSTQSSDRCFHGLSKFSQNK